MAEYLIKEESLTEIADVVRTHFEYYDGVMQMITEKDKLTSIVIPDGATTIGETAFNNCNRLTDIYLYPTTPPTLVSTNAIRANTTIHVPVGCGDVYRNATNWSSFADKIVEDIAT